MNDFIKILDALQQVGATSYKQQSMVYLLWREGPKTMQEVVSAIPFLWDRNNIEQALTGKGLLMKLPPKKGGTSTIIYSVTDDVDKFLNKKINGS